MLGYGYTSHAGAIIYYWPPTVRTKQQARSATRQKGGCATQGETQHREKGETDHEYVQSGSCRSTILRLPPQQALGALQGLDKTIRELIVLLP